jgi:protein phosphatase
MTLTGLSDIGKRYEENQDSYRAGKINGSLYWMILCDGMGGLSDGKQASRLAVETVASYMTADMMDYSAVRDKSAYLCKAAQAANRAVFEQSIRIGENQMMGTTMVLAVVEAQEATILHCGDSRAYHYQRRTLKQLTKDHSFVQELVDSGHLSPEEAVTHPKKNIITRALGIEPKVKFDVINTHLSKNDVLMLCSDGLSNQVDENRMISIFRYNDIYDVPRLMIEAGLEAGGFDNMTTVMLQI